MTVYLTGAIIAAAIAVCLSIATLTYFLEGEISFVGVMVIHLLLLLLIVAWPLWIILIPAAIFWNIDHREG